MPSYNKHALFSIIIALPFFQDVFYLSLAVIGASIIDMDHHVKNKSLNLMAISGILLSLMLYMLKFPFLFGVSLITMAFIFYISPHRGFTHSIFGISLLSFLLALSISGLISLFGVFDLTNKLTLLLITIILGIIILNRKIILPFLIIAATGIIFMHNNIISQYYIFFAIFLGCLSHIMLDLFTPSGIKPLNPLFAKKFGRTLGIALLIFWIFGAIIVNFKEIIHFV